MTFRVRDAYGLVVCLFHRRNMIVCAKFIYGLVFDVDSNSGWAKLGVEQVPYDVNGQWDQQVSVHREAYAWTQMCILKEGKSLSKLPNASAK